MRLKIFHAMLVCAKLLLKNADRLIYRARAGDERSRSQKRKAPAIDTGAPCLRFGAWRDDPHNAILLQCDWGERVLNVTPQCKIKAAPVEVGQKHNRRNTRCLCARRHKHWD